MGRERSSVNFSRRPESLKNVINKPRFKKMKWRSEAVREILSNVKKKETKKYYTDRNEDFIRGLIGAMKRSESGQLPLKYYAKKYSGIAQNSARGNNSFELLIGEKLKGLIQGKGDSNSLTTVSDWHKNNSIRNVYNAKLYYTSDSDDFDKIKCRDFNTWRGYNKVFNNTILERIKSRRRYWRMQRHKASSYIFDRKKCFQFQTSDAFTFVPVTTVSSSLNQEISIPSYTTESSGELSSEPSIKMVPKDSFQIYLKHTPYRIGKLEYFNAFRPSKKTCTIDSDGCVISGDERSICSCIGASYPCPSVEASYPCPSVEASYPCQSVRASYPCPSVRASYLHPSVGASHPHPSLGKSSLDRRGVQPSAVTLYPNRSRTRSRDRTSRPDRTYSRIGSSRLDSKSIYSPIGSSRPDGRSIYSHIGTSWTEREGPNKAYPSEKGLFPMKNKNSRFMNAFKQFFKKTKETKPPDEELQKPTVSLSMVTLMSSKEANNIKEDQNKNKEIHNDKGLYNDKFERMKDWLDHTDNFLRSKILGAYKKIENWRTGKDQSGNTWSNTKQRWANFNLNNQKEKSSYFRKK